MFNEKGYLAPGLHNWTCVDFKLRLVDGFSGSRTRLQIFNGFMLLRLELLKFVKLGHQIVDGSYCTHKTDPNDVDVVTFLDLDELNGLDAAAQDSLQNLFKGPNSKGEFYTDSYLVWSVPEGHQLYPEYLQSRRYWLGQFGFDRQEVPKGLVVLNIDDTSLNDTKEDAV
ncbi:DUF6932 family protein [Deinococcus sp. PESE-13]